MSDLYDYPTPHDFDARLDEIRRRALTDKALAEALRGLLIDTPDYARGVLSALSFERLGSDYACTEDRLSRLGAAAKALSQDDGRDFVEAFFRPDLSSPEVRSAREALQGERARAVKIRALIEQVKLCGETPDYDGAPA